MIESIGLAATVFILVSFLFNQEKKIRVINLVGAVLFVIYGYLIAAPSVYILNGALIVIHIYKIYKMSKVKEEPLDER
jgi:cell shape-determining protein MreD